MDVTKLRIAAQLLAQSNPDLSQELNSSADQLSNQPDLNPNIKNYGDLSQAPAPAEDNKESHEISFKFNVPPGHSKTDLLNHAMDAFNNHPAINDNNIEVTGYSFKS
jgi:hypothetical protein